MIESLGKQNFSLATKGNIMDSPKFNRYPTSIYDAYNKYFGSEFTPGFIDKQEDVKIASHSLAGGYEEYCKLILNYRLDNRIYD
jgi:hypothetical protein